MQISASRRTDCLTKTPSLADAWIESVSNLPGPFEASDSWITDFRLNYCEDCPFDKMGGGGGSVQNIDLVGFCARFLDFWTYARNSRDGREWNTCRTRIDRKYDYSIYQILIHLVSYIYESNIAGMALYIST